ncbi:MAG: hypothetical protein CL912_13195 [Deltaproteobacteria bacterium]|nr:hypothetical protein [Deltaproteobacteria bacterium]|tara:strand:- start:20 stop:535 length:516 start_codon:yes stop_codon:yes gene_type:complete
MSLYQYFCTIADFILVVLTNCKPKVSMGVESQSALLTPGSLACLESIELALTKSSIDYNLPALGGGIGPGFKVAYGYDLVGDYDANGNPAPDDDPMDCLGHGTHVAGIIGASNDPYILGVAPNATLHMYKVFACEDNAPTDILIQAFIMAHNNGVDVITSSIGSNNGWPEE